VSANYASRRCTDPRIAARVHAALGDARTVLNVGAGTGSYEPPDREVVAVEPDPVMRAQRTTPAIDAVAEDLPFDDDAFDAAMATITLHQWRDVHRGLAELRRVTRGPVVLLTFDPDHLADFWLADYVPEIIAHEQRRFPPLPRLAAALGGEVTIEAVPIPIDCTDGFIEAYYARPEAFLDPDVRAAQSMWRFIRPGELTDGLHHLETDLRTGAWDARHGALRTQPTYEGALRLLRGGGQTPLTPHESQGV
jgi:SAM-dependent methyltransferase